MLDRGSRTTPPAGRVTLREVFPARLLLHADEAHGVVKTSLPSIAGAIGSVCAST
jgi:hypothetical protein